MVDMSGDAWKGSWVRLTRGFGLYERLDKKQVPLWEEVDPDELRNALIHKAAEIFDWPDRCKMPARGRELMLTQEVMAGVVGMIQLYFRNQDLPVDSVQAGDAERIQRVLRLKDPPLPFQIRGCKRDAWVYARTRKPFREDDPDLARLAAEFSRASVVPLVAAAALVAAAGTAGLVRYMTQKATPKATAKATRRATRRALP